jgi:hypothetical protein
VRLLDGNNALKKFDDRFRPIFLFLLFCKLLTDILDVFGKTILLSILFAETIRNVLLAFIMSNSFRIFPWISFFLPLTCTVSW